VEEGGGGVVRLGSCVRTCSLHEAGGQGAGTGRVEIRYWV
jgi:hypothetical protein